MRGDEDTEVGYVEQPVNRLYRDGLAGQVAPNVESEKLRFGQLNRCEHC